MNNATEVEEQKAEDSLDELESKNDASGNIVIEELGKANDEEIGVEEIPKECVETFDELKEKIDIKNAENETKNEGEQELECEEVEATEI